MKDLQELFETMSTKDFADLAALVDKKSINPKNQERVFNMISEVYCGEMNVDEAELSESEMTKLIDDFVTSITLYEGVVKGTMIIKSGRMKLTDGNSCSFSLTPAGVKRAEELLKQ